MSFTGKILAKLCKSKRDDKPTALTAMQQFTEKAQRLNLPMPRETVAPGDLDHFVCPGQVTFVSTGYFDTPQPIRHAIYTTTRSSTK